MVLPLFLFPWKYIFTFFFPVQIFLFTDFYMSARLTEWPVVFLGFGFVTPLLRPPFVSNPRITALHSLILLLSPSGFSTNTDHFYSFFLHRCAPFFWGAFDLPHGHPAALRPPLQFRPLGRQLECPWTAPASRRWRGLRLPLVGQ